MNEVKNVFLFSLRFWAILVVSILAGILLFFVSYYIAYTISPPLFIDADGTGRAVMPIGQVMIGILAGVAGGVILLIYLLRKNRHHFR